MSNKMLTKLKQLFHWLDEHILLLMSGFLIAFIPLYPKLPLLEAIPGYIVRVRLEDVFVLLAALIWLVQVFRKKISWCNIVLWLMVAYAISGLLSVLSAVFLIKTVPLELIHVGKTALHFFRYMEYFTLFVITFSAIKSKKDVQTLLTIFTLTVVAVTIYGYGQKFYYWPVFSTMNREFSKGMRLYLTEHARVQSTFGGHYDLAAFLVIALSMVLALAFKQETKWKKLWFHGIHLIGLWLLLMTASRTSFISYLFGALVVVVMVAKEQKTLADKIKWGAGRYALILVISGIMTIGFGQDMYERFLHVLKGYPNINHAYHTANDYRKQTTRWVLVTVGIKERPDQDRQPPENGIAVDDVLTDTDQRPVSEKPDDVYVDVPVTEKVATTSADGTVTYVNQKVARTWSANALKYGLSTAIRLDTLWPNAINGFLQNPLVGSGYATLNKDGKYQFTEAESTDNNFLRTLGETGLMGFISFYGIVAVSIYLAYKFHHVDRSYTSAISVGFIGASMGLLLNATYIDVFAASKVAFTYWALTGIVMALYYLDQNKKKLKQMTLFERWQAIKAKLGFKRYE